MWDLRAEKWVAKEAPKLSRNPWLGTFFQTTSFWSAPLGSTRQLSQKRDQHGNPTNFKSKCSTRSCFLWNFFHHKRWRFRFLSTPFFMNFPMMSVYPRFKIQNTAPGISHFWGAVLASVLGHCLLCLRRAPSHETPPCHEPPSSKHHPAHQFFSFRQAGDLDRCPQVFHLKVRIRTLFTAEPGTASSPTSSICCTSHKMHLELGAGSSVKNLVQQNATHNESGPTVAGRWLVYRHSHLQHSASHWRPQHKHVHLECVQSLLGPQLEVAATAPRAHADNCEVVVVVEVRGSVLPDASKFVVDILEILTEAETHGLLSAA